MQRALDVETMRLNLLQLGPRCRCSRSSIGTGHVAPSPSSGCAAPTLRFGRCAMTAPGRRGKGLSSRVANEKRPLGAAFAQQHDLRTKRQRRAQRSRVASATAKRRDLTASAAIAPATSRQNERARNCRTSGLHCNRRTLAPMRKRPTPARRRS